MAAGINVLTTLNACKKKTLDSRNSHDDLAMRTRLITPQRISHGGWSPEAAR